MLVNTPPMGWNSWNTFGTNITDELIREIADKFIELGLDKAGYQYVVIDDCWSERDRDSKTGKIVPDKKKFPKGMKAVSDYVHSKGLKFGMYSCAGVRTCADYPGSYDHEFLDAETFAEYGVDFLKYDFCWKPSTANGPLLYRRMGNALRACGRDILFSACNWGSDNVWTWIRSAGAHMYRSTGDIFDNATSFSDIAKSQMEKFCYSAPQCFNDMDMLTVGMYGKGNVGREEGEMSKEEKEIWFRRYQNQFSLWCLMGSPLMLGSDIRKMDRDILELITNRDLIRINQDPECRPAFVVRNWPVDCACVMAKLLSDGTIAVGMFNFTEDRHGAQIMNEELGFSYASGYTLDYKDIFTGEVITTDYQEKVYEIIPPYGCRMFIVTPRKRGTAAKTKKTVKKTVKTAKKK